MLRSLFSFMLCAVFFFSCTKQPADTKYCWQLVDNLGNQLNMVCDKTEQELIDCAANGTCGTYNGGAGLGSCNYFRVDEPTYCWLINNRYHSSLSEKFVNCWYGNLPNAKVACDATCENYYTRRMMTYKPTNTFVYSFVSPMRAYCGDTATAFKTAAPFVLKNTADSLILLQYSKDGVNWY